MLSDTLNELENLAMPLIVEFLGLVAAIEIR